MTNKNKNIAVTIIMSVFILGLSVFCWVKPQDDFSFTERRNLKKFPEVKFQTIIDGSFMQSFEKYTLDQFPLRDSFRKIKAFSNYNIFIRKDNNKIYKTDDGYLSKIEYPLNDGSINKVSNRFKYVYDKYLKGTNTKNYLAVIPDKNYFLGEDEKVLTLNYNQFVADLKKETQFLTYIDIFDTLNKESFYKTDTHWRQEKILPTAKKLLLGMNTYTKATEYKENTLNNTFYGVYHGQSALNIDGEELKYLVSDGINNAVVKDFQNNKEITVYNMEKAEGKDPYEIYLSGSLSLIEINNSKAKTDKELVIFRDSFGSSIAPLFIDSYKKITLVDIRYIHPDMLKHFIEFNNQDVLFLYSTLVLNNGETLK